MTSEEKLMNLIGPTLSYIEIKASNNNWIRIHGLKYIEYSSNYNLSEIIDAFWKSLFILNFLKDPSCNSINFHFNYDEINYKVIIYLTTKSCAFLGFIPKEQVRYFFTALAEGYQNVDKSI